MKQFKTIFLFEFKGMLQTKAYRISTAVFILFAVVGMLIPTFTGGFGDDTEPSESLVDQFEDEATFAILDESHSFDEGVFKMYFPNVTFKEVKDNESLEKQVKDGDYDAGFRIKQDFDYIYYVNDSSMSDMRSTMFGEALSQMKRNEAYEKAGIDASEAMNIFYSNTSTGETVALGSDGASNFLYTFGLIMIIYMVTILYGTMVATSVASEKGNRTMEVLVTSAKPSSLIFGKVLATASAAVLQIGLFFGSAIIMYTYVGDAWDGMLDMIFNIPLDVLSAFALFGITGFIFYSFIFGALGALVSKSEDVSSSVTPVTIIFVVIYFIVYIGVMSPDSMIFKVASFIPLSSPMAMFARMAMVDVPVFEVLISFVLLILSTLLVGYTASKIYRRGTLMYGNQIKLRHALKWLKKED